MRFFEEEITVWGENRNVSGETQEIKRADWMKQSIWANAQLQKPQKIGTMRKRN